MKEKYLNPEIDSLLVSPEIMRDPYPIYARLRNEAPALWSENWQSWVFSRYGDVGASLKDKNLSNRSRQALLFSEFTPSQLEQTAFLRTYFAQQDIINSDPPDHTRMRAPVQKALMPKVIAGMEEKARRLAHRLWDEAAQDKTFDFVGRFAYPFPVILVAEILGAPPEDRLTFKDWTADFLAFQGTGRADFERTMLSQKSLADFVGYVENLVERRRAKPETDLVSALIESDYTTPELVATCCTLLVAGHETTTNLLGNIVHLLHRHPGQLDILKNDHKLIPPAIEESLRFEAPKQRNFRRAMRTHEFSGVTIQENEMVFQLIGSANHDERAFENPDVYDITRSPNAHLTFGAGIHFCVGAVLARLEAKVFLELFLDFPGTIRVIDDSSFHWQDRVQMRGPGSMFLEVGTTGR
ncbi:MAG: cytochrome P450 [Terrimicrobiaceae bacterium]